MEKKPHYLFSTKSQMKIHQVAWNDENLVKINIGVDNVTQESSAKLLGITFNDKQN